MQSAHPSYLASRLARAGAIGVAALGLVALRACAWVVELDPGNRVRVTLAPTTWPAEAGYLRRDDGASVLLEDASLEWTHAHLVPCVDGIAHRGGVAYAHGTAVAHAGAYVESLVARDGTALAELTPPSGTYCGLVVSADGLALEGFFRASDEATWQAFALADDAAFEVDVPLDHLTLAGDVLVVRVDKDASAWFDDIDPLAPDAAAAVRARVRESIEIHAELE